MISRAVTLRPYQERTVGELRTAMRQHRRCLLVSPTGSGKSIMIAYMIRRAAERGLRIWLVCHRKELLEQLSDTLWSMGVQHGLIAAGHPTTADKVQVASIQTLWRRLDRLDPPDLLCYDEAHHAVSGTSMKLFAACPDAWTIGLTASPQRLDGRGLGDIFDTIVEGPSVAELIEAGHLSRYRILGPPPEAVDYESVRVRRGDYVVSELESVVDNSKIIGDAVSHYQRFVAPHTCLVFCVSRNHARHVASAYQRAGVRAKYVGGDTPKGERSQAVRDFKDGKLQVLTSVQLFSEGVDSPGLRSVQILRPTQSLALWVQMVGRGLRVEEGKEECIILDHVGSCYQFGLPDDEREWSLEGRKKRKGATEAGPALASCPAPCFAIFSATLLACPSCGKEREPSGREDPEEVDGELVEIDPEEHRRQRRREEAMARGMEDLVALARERGYRPGWAAHRYAARKKGEITVEQAKALEFDIRRAG